MGLRCSEEGTWEMPSPAETRPKVEPMRGAWHKVSPQLKAAANIKVN